MGRVRVRGAGSVAGVLRPLASLFGEPVHLSRKDKAGKWIHGVIGGRESRLLNEVAVGVPGCVAK
jgi:hypothetical protein